MSRLDSFIRRLKAQRACLDAAAAAIDDIPGVIFELGLGNGRTFDHLRHLLPHRRILVFERDPRPHPECRPSPEDLVVGNLEETLVAAIGEWRGAVALIHSDIGTGDTDRNRRLAKVLAKLLPPFLTVGGIIASDQPLPEAGLDIVPPPSNVPSQRYSLYRQGGTSA